MGNSDNKTESMDQPEQTLSIEQKARFFDELAKRFYNRNFGTVTKAEFDLMMFHFYFEPHKNKFEKPSTYAISKALGITQERVRNLIVKENLIYPSTTDVKVFFNTFLKSKIQYNKTQNSVEIPVLDPRVLIEIEHEIELAGGFVRYKANKKSLAVSLADFSKLLLRFDDKLKGKEKDEAQKLISTAAAKEKELTPDRLQELLGKTLPLLTSSVPCLASLFPASIFPGD